MALFTDKGPGACRMKEAQMGAGPSLRKFNSSKILLKCIF